MYLYVLNQSVHRIHFDTCFLGLGGGLEGFVVVTTSFAVVVTAGSFSLEGREMSRVGSSALTSPL